MKCHFFNRCRSSNWVPTLATDFFNKLGTADLLVISFAEHNGAYSAAFKNIFDWISRIHATTFQEKQTLIMATSPGPRRKLRFRNRENRLPFKALTSKEASHYLVLMIILIQRME
jgi:NAD(P)H-dependent FMN reductase